MKEEKLVNSQELQLILERLAAQILEKHMETRELFLVGIQRRGADLAKRLATILGRHRQLPPTGSLDINLYRDDWTALKGGAPLIGQSHMPPNIDESSIILVDDVLFTGRTIRAALEAILDYGRPRQVELLVLVDRGHRELPIQANYIGRKVETAKNQQVNVLLEERDGADEIILKEI